MDYSDIVYSARFYLPIVTALFFAIKLIGGERRDRIHSFIICFICALYFLIPNIDVTLSKELYKTAYIEALYIVILISGAGMLSMFSMIFFDNKAFIHALLLAFIILVNFMLTWHYTISPQSFFYTYFDELLIIAGILQIMVSHNGIIDSISRITRFFRVSQRVSSGVFVPCVRWVASISKYKKSKERT